MADFVLRERPITVGFVDTACSKISSCVSPIRRSMHHPASRNVSEARLTPSVCVSPGTEANSA